MSTKNRLAPTKLDWNDFTETSRVTRNIIGKIADNRTKLRQLVLSATENTQLRALAEKHHELNYIVLQEDSGSGMRLRLHRFTAGLEDIPHNHRFSFSSIILLGSYEHSTFELIPARDGASEKDH